MRASDSSGRILNIASTTGFQARAGIEDSRVRRLLPHTNVEFVAAKSYDAMMAGKRSVIPGLFNRMGAFSIRFMPRWVPLQIIEFLHS